jgi:GNAT superfamily N-acetyltransferase
MMSESSDTPVMLPTRLLGMSELVDIWSREAQGASVDLRSGLARFPELERAVTLPGYRAEIQQGSGLVAGDEGVRVALSVRWVSPGSRELGTYSFDIHTGEQVAEIAGLRLAPEARGHGLGRLLVRLMARLGDELDLEAVILMAADVGRYAWPRLGFDFMEGEDRALALEEAARFARRLGRAAELGQVEHSWELAELPGPTISLADFAAARGDPLPVRGGIPLRWGQALLLGPAIEWAGRLDLRPDSRSRAQLERGELRSTAA